MDKNITLKIDTKLAASGAAAGLASLATAVQGSMSKLTTIIAHFGDKVKTIAGLLELGALLDGVARSSTKAAAGQSLLAKATTAAGRAANTAMASFDELNLLQRSSGSGGGSTAKPEKPAVPDEGGYSGIEELLARLHKALEPLGKAIWAGLEWGYSNILKPLGEWTVNSALPAFIELLSAAFGVLCGVLAPLKPLAVWLWEGLMIPLAGWTGDTVVAAIGGIAGALSALSDWLDSSRGAFEGFVSGIMPLFEGVGGALTAVLEGIGQGFALWWESLGDTMAGSLDLMAGLLTGNWEQAWQGVSLIFDTTKNLLLEQLSVLCMGFLEGFLALWTGLQELLLPVWEWINLNVITPIADNFGWLFNFVLTAADVGLHALMGLFGPLVGWLTSKVVMPIAELMKWLWDDMTTNARIGLESIVGWVGDYISHTLEMAAVGLNFFIGLINKLIDGLNSIQVSIPRWVPKYGGESFGINISHIPTVAVPKLATGAVIPANREFLALLGDQKSGRNLEAPESLIRQIVREESGAGQDGRPLSVELLLDGDVIYEAMLEREERRGLRIGGAFANAY